MTQSTGNHRLRDLQFDSRELLQPLPTIKLTEVFFRQRWIIVGCVLLGRVLAVAYVRTANVKYESTARILVNQGDSNLVSPTAANTNGDNLISEDILANHIELLRSRKNVSGALERAGLTESAFILAELDDDEDAIDYVIRNLKLSRGGKGDSKAARSIQVLFQHTNADEAKLILDSVVSEYMLVIKQQFAESLSLANRLILQSQDKIQSDLKTAQKEYVDSRRNAPVLFTGDGSSNIYVEQYKTLSNQLIALEIEKSTLQGRLQKADTVAAMYLDPSLTMPIEALGVIDSESLQRLGVFASMKANTANSADFQMNQPERLEEARTQYSHLLRLMSEKQRLESDFGAGHPEVRKLQDEINLVEKFLKDNKVESDTQMDEPQLTSRQLLGAYIGFLKNELSSIAERRAETTTRIEFAEKQARSLVDFELNDVVLRSQIDRNQQLFDSMVEQLRMLNMSHNVEGYIHELLEQPRPGIKVWPKLSVCGAGGVMLGLMFGLFFAIINDQLNARFQTTQELSSAIDTPVLGYVDKLNVARSGSPVVGDLIQGESFRMLRTLLLSDVRDGRLSTISVSSPSSGDGKSTILMNMAASFASLGMPVVIVEADMRRPTLKARMGLNVEHGLSEVLLGSCSLAKAVGTSDVPNLSVIHAGSATGNPAELLESESFDALLKELRSQFVLTIVDVGPILAVSDSAVVARKVDGTILIVRPSIDTRKQITGAAEMLKAANVNLLGMVVNTFGSSKHFLSGREGYGSKYTPTRALESV